MDDDVYDSEMGVIDYHSLPAELRERTDTLIEHSLRPSEYFDRGEDDDTDDEESDVELRRRHGPFDEE